MKTTVYKSLIAVCVLGMSMLNANGQVLPSASAALSAHDLTVSSAAAYAELEIAINELSGQLHDAYVEHPNLQFRPAYSAENEIIGYLVTGDGSAKEANAIAKLLVELDMLGAIASTVDPAYLPTAKNDRVSKRDARN